MAWTDYQSCEIDLKEKWIKKHRDKSNILFRVPIHNVVLDIIKRYNGKPKMTNQVFNRNIKELLKKIDSFDFEVSDNYNEPVKFYEAISSHTGRHTFIDLGLKNGWPIQKIMSYVGHTKPDQLIAYAKKHLKSDEDFVRINEL